MIDGRTEKEGEDLERESAVIARDEIYVKIFIFIQMLEASRISENSWSLAGLRATHSGYFTQGRFTIGSQSDPDTSLGTNFFHDQRTHAPITKIKSLYLNRVACVQLAKKVFRGGAEGMLWSKGRRDLELRTSGY